MLAECLDRSVAVPVESPACVDAAFARGDGGEVGATAPAEPPETRANAVSVSPAHGGDGDTFLERARGVEEGGVAPGAEVEVDGFADDCGMDGDEGDVLVAESSWEGAGVSASGSRRFGLMAPRIPPMPREDAVPDPVASRRGRLSGGRFRRNPSVDEAIAELARPIALSDAERAAAVLRSKRRARSGDAMRQPLAAGERAVCTPQQRLLLLDTWNRSGLPAGDFGALVGVSKHTLYS
jgi:hypothetical protein